jgi:tetratricopeptide (TPR) repeat protein
MNASATTAGSPGTLRAAANAASMLGQHDTAIEYLRKSVRFDADRHSVARTHVLLAAELRIAGKLADAEAELLEPQESANAQVLAEALEERALLRLAQDLPDTAIEDLRAADRQYAQLGLEFNRIDTNTVSRRLCSASVTSRARLPQRTRP